MKPLDTPIRISHYEYDSYVEGPGGPRTVIFMVGCPIRCPGCQSPHLFDPNEGHQTTVKDVLNHVVPLNRPVTILGGEPFIQPEALAVLTDFLQQYDLHTMVYSGYTFEDLAAMRYKIPSIYNIFSNIDVLVDGPYIQAMNDDMVQWRGSKNQRAIDMRRTWGFRIEPVLLDWDRRQTITILENGDILATKGLIALLAEEGDVVERNRQCGEPHHGR